MRSRSHNQDWETPDSISSFLASLIEEADGVILEPCAGSGQLLKFLPRDRRVIAFENNLHRFTEAQRSYPWVDWHIDFFSSVPSPVVDVVIANPPFLDGVNFLARSLAWLKPTGRCLYLLPSDYFQSKSRCDQFRNLDCYIYRAYQFRGRIAYLKDGIPHRNRQCYDTVFDIRPGKELGGVVLVG